MLILCLFSMGTGYTIKDKLSKVSFINTKNRAVTIYGLNSKYESELQIPSDKLKLYQIDAGSSAKYTVKTIKGSAASVSKDGTIVPANVTWYWYGNIGYSSPLIGQTPDKIETRIYPGESIVTAKVGDTSFNITVTTIEYGEEYAENIINSYLKTNVTNQKTTLDKFTAITAFPAQYPYDFYYQTYIDMIVFKGGDCWASADTIQHFCELVNIKSHVTSEVLLPGMWTGGHKNVAALINGKIYVGEAGFFGLNPNRLYKVIEQNVGYFYNISGNELTISQYDGYDEDIKVPSTIDGYTVVGFYKTKMCFFYGQSWSGIKIKAITLPDTVYSLGNQVFNNLVYLLKVNLPYNVTEINISVFDGCVNLESINIADKNPKYSSENGVLFNKNKTILLKYPQGKKGSFTGPSTLERIEDYSFNGTKNIDIVKFRDKVNYIGSYAFSFSNLKEIYFFGDPPEFGEKAFNGSNITFYYPENNKNWNSVEFAKLGLKDSRSFSWKPKEDEDKNSKAILKVLFIAIPCIVIIIIAFLVYIVYIMIRKSNNKISENINTLDGGLLKAK